LACLSEMLVVQAQIPPCGPIPEPCRVCAARQRACVAMSALCSQHVWPTVPALLRGWAWSSPVTYSAVQCRPPTRNRVTSTSQRPVVHRRSVPVAARTLRTSRQPKQRVRLLGKAHTPIPGASRRGRCVARVKPIAV